ncbi:MAG: nucleotidyltransferase domain-containing protein [Armatimonadetes bacterium]|nr:nucleotidyltransferase domain-containing protein [Armatimonadota bacterium]
MLALLYGRPDEEFHLRDIIRYSGVGHGAVQRELSQLVCAGLVSRRKQANLALFRANRHSPIYAEVHGLVAKTAGVVETVRAALQPLSGRIAVAFVYGSVAAGTETSASDLDLMLVGAVTLDEVVPVLMGAHEQVGREINPNLYTPDDFGARVRDRDRFLSTVLEGPRLYVIGGDHELGELVGARLAQQVLAVAAGDR